MRKVCFNRGQETNQIEEILKLENGEHRRKFLTTLRVNNKQVEFELDTGAAVSVMGIKLARSLFPGAPVRYSDLKLISFCGKEIETLGFITVKVQNQDNQRELDLYVTKNNRSPLLGREWISQLRCGDNLLDSFPCLDSINAAETRINSQLQKLLDKYKEIQLPGI